jgi:hypothetical protein
MKSSTKLTLLGVLLVVVVSSLAAPIPPKPQESPERGLAEARLKAAQAAFQLYQKQGDINDPETSYRWSRRLLEAQRDLAQDRSEIVAAFQAHLDRMARLDNNAKDWAKANIFEKQLAFTGFYRAEAELWLAREKAKK